MNKPDTRERSSNIGFRLSQFYLDRLGQLAEGAGMSTHSFARFLLIQTLEQTEAHHIQDGLKEIRDELRAFRSEFNSAVESPQD